MSDLVILLQEKAGTLRAEIARLRERRTDIDRELRRFEDSLMHVEALLKDELAQVQGQLPEQTLFPMPVVARLSRGRKSIPQLVANMLAEKDRPMHADEIRAELEGKGYVFSAKDPKASVVTALIRAKQRNLVEQVAPNTFRLSAGYRERLLESNEEEANPG